jgi:hypothetical protein
MLRGKAQQLGAGVPGCPDDSHGDHIRMIIRYSALSCNDVVGDTANGHRVLRQPGRLER